MQVYTEQWNDVCGDNWGVEEMEIACRQQGYLPKHPLNFPIGRLTFFFKTSSILKNNYIKYCV